MGPDGGFTGHFDGDYHVVSGLYCVTLNSGENGTGFFTQVSDYASVEHLGIVNAYISGGKDVGGISGWLLNGSVINECFFEGTLESTNYNTGGIVGISEGNTQITNCYSTGHIFSTSHYVGGIIGQNATNSTIANCYSNMMIESDGSITAAICGYNDISSSVSNCYYDKQTSPLNTNSLAGGLLTTEMTGGTWNALGAAFSYTAGLYPYISGFDLNNPSVAMSVIPFFLYAVSSSEYEDVNVFASDFTLGYVPGASWSCSSWNNAITIDGLNATIHKHGMVDMVVQLDTLQRSYILIPKKAPFVGSEGNPFTIDNLEELVLFRKGINGGQDFTYKRFDIQYRNLANVHWLQTADIDMSSLVHLNDKGATVNDWVAVGTSTFKFTGYYHGGNHKILNFKVPTTNNYGLFGYADYGYVYDLTFENPTISGGSTHGFVMGSATHSHIQNCHVLNGNISTSGSSIGGICGGATYSLIRDCSVENTTFLFTASSYPVSGGILGNGGGYDTLINCYARGGSITATGTNANLHVGGICGRMYGGGDGLDCGDYYKTIFDSCFNEMPIVSAGGCVGGICGWAQQAAEFIRCYNKANIKGTNSVAGISGYQYSGPHFRYCYNSGQIVGTSKVGGIFGEGCTNLYTNRASASYACFNTGTIIGTSGVGGIWGTGEGQWHDVVNYGLVIGKSSVAGCCATAAYNGGISTKMINVGQMQVATLISIASVMGSCTWDCGILINDKQMCQYGPYANGTSSGIQKNTEEMLGDGLRSYLNEEYWEFTEGMYPRIKYWKDADAAIVAATPLILSSTDQDSKSVKENILLGGCDYGVVWQVDSGDVVDHIETDCSNNQTVAVINPNAEKPTYLSLSRNGVVYKQLQIVPYINPYKDTLTIDSLADLVTLRDGVNSGYSFRYHNVLLLSLADSAVFRLTTDIVMPDSNWVPIGDRVNPFKAQAFLGEGHTISNLHCSSGREAGLFGCLTGKVQDLNMTEVSITGGAFQGAICARLEGTISNCIVEGSISGGTYSDSKLYAGGLVGYATNKAQVSDCVNRITVLVDNYQSNTNAYAGGCVGACYNANDKIMRCVNEAPVTGWNYVGGICGSSGTISYCYNTADITGLARSAGVGGICASASATTTFCFNVGAVTALQGNQSSDRYVGGICGQSAVSYCYNAGIVDGNNAKYVSGLSAASCTYSYNSNTVRSTGSKLGSVGATTAKPTKTYYDCQMSTAAGYVGTDAAANAAMAKTTDEMLGTGLQGVLGAKAADIAANWSFHDGLYPQLKYFEGTDASLSSVMALRLGRNRADDTTQTWKMVDNSFRRSAGDWEILQGSQILQLEQGSNYVQVSGMGVAMLGAKVNDTIYRKCRLLLQINENNPFVIKNETELKNFRDVINQNGYYNRSAQTYHLSLTAEDSTRLEYFVPIDNGGLDMYFKLIADLDMSEETDFWRPVGDATVTFKGSFDGDGHKIMGLRLGSGDYQGLFGYSAGLIHDLKMESATMEGSGQYKAILCGYSDGGQIRDCEVNHSVIAGTSTYTGALIGYNQYANIVRCSVAYDSITTTGDYVGGIAAYNNTATVDTCYADHLYLKGTSKYNGGIVGGNGTGVIRMSDIVNCELKDVGENSGGICGTSSTNSSTPAIFMCNNINSVIQSNGSTCGGIAGSFNGNATYSNAIMQNCKVYGGSISSTGSSVGGIVGSTNVVYVRIEDCTNHNPVTGSSGVGGIVGSHTHGVVRACVNTGDVTATSSSAGGVLGSTNSSQHLSSCYNRGHVKGVTGVGGLVGTMAGYADNHGVITGSFNEGTVTGDQNVGGLVGSNTSTTSFSSCYNTGIVKGSTRVGGLVGYQSKAAKYDNTYSYNAGYVSGISMVGAICGYSENHVNKFDHCFYDKQMAVWGGIADADIAATTSKLTTEMLGTALQGELDSEAEPQWVFKEGMYPQIKGLDTTKESITSVLPVFLPANEDLEVRANDVPAGHYGLGGCDSVQWVRYEGSGLSFPGCDTMDVFGRNYVKIANVMDGDTFKLVQLVLGISEEHPLEIVSLEQFKNFRNLVNTNQTFYYDAENHVFYANEDESYVKIKPGGEDMYFKLTTDIDLSLEMQDWIPIGNYQETNAETKLHTFRGHFNGAEHTVKGLHLNNNSNYQGLFGCVNGVVKNVRMEDVNIQGGGSSKYRGAIAAMNQGAILHCSGVGGVVKGTTYVGGLVGRNTTGQISYCYSNTMVSGGSYLGGIVGINDASSLLTECFNEGIVSGTSERVGGIAGQSNSEISYCYNVGAVTGTKYLGGIVGFCNTPSIQYCYNAGIVQTTLADPTYIGAILSATEAANFPTNCFYDIQMSTLSGGIGEQYQSVDNVGKATGYFTDQMVGTSLADGLGTEYWIYSDSLYPQLKKMSTLDASVASVYPIFISDYLDCQHVDFPIHAKISDSLTWSHHGEGMSLDLSHINEDGQGDILICGEDTLKISLNRDYKLVPICVGRLASEIHRDTVCDGYYVWEANGRVYTHSDSITLAITIVDGCDSVLTLVLTIPPVLEINIESQNYPCFESTEAYAIAHVTGGFNQGYFYEWRNASDSLVSTDSLLSNPEPGIYTLTVSDMIHPQCEKSAEVEITRPTELILSETGHDTRCYNTDDGFIAFQVEGGVSPYTVRYSATDSLVAYYSPSTDTFETLPAGIYTIQATDANGCVKTVENIDLTEDATPYSLSAFAANKLYDGDTIYPHRYVLKIGDGEAVTYASGDTVALPTGDSLYAAVSLTDTALRNVCQKKNSIVEYAIFNRGEDRTCRYNITDADVEQDVIIAKRRVIIESMDSSKAYDGTPLTNRTILISGDGFADGEDTLRCTVTGSQTVTGYSLNEFTYELTPATNINNYEIIKNEGILVVGAHDTVIVITPNSSKTYDGTPLYDRRFTSTGDILETDSLVVEIDASITDAGTTQNAITSYKIIDKISGEDHTAQYKFGTPVIGMLTVNRRPVTLLSPSASKVYDGTPLNGTSTVTVLGDGFVAGEVISCTAQMLAVADTIENTIEITKGASYKDDNYDLTVTPGTLAISKRPLEITGQSNTVIYSGHAQSVTAYNAAVVAGHSVSNLTYLAQGTTAGTYPGEFSGTVIIKDGESNDVTSNYEITQTPGSLTINPSEYPLMVKSANGSATYNGDFHRFQNYTVAYNGQTVAPVTGTLKYVLQTGDTLEVLPKDAGLGVIHVSESGPNAFAINLHNAENYSSITLDTGNIVISKRMVDLRSRDERITYNGVTILPQNNQDLNVDRSGVGFVIGENVMCTFTGYQKDVGTSQNTFTYEPIVGTDINDYEITSTFGTLMVTKARLTVTPVDAERLYGEPDPELHYIVTGFVNNEDTTTAPFIGTARPVLSTTATASSPIGIYDINVDLTGVGFANYTVSEGTGTFTIYPRSITMQANSLPSRVYDGYAHTWQETEAPHYTFDGTGLMDGDSITSVIVAGSRTVAGVGQIELNNAMVEHFEINGQDTTRTDVTSSYVITYNPGTITITPQELTLKPMRFEHDFTGNVYNSDSTSAPHYVIAAGSLVGNDTVAKIRINGSRASYGKTPFVIDSASIKIVNRNDVAEEIPDTRLHNAGYHITLLTDTLVINHRSEPYIVQMKGKSDTIEYDGLSHRLTGWESAKFQVDGFTYYADSTNFVSKVENIDSVGVYRTFFTGTFKMFDVNGADVSTEFTVDTVPGYLTVTPKTLTITAMGLDTTYDYVPHTYLETPFPHYYVSGLSDADAVVSCRLSGTRTLVGRTPILIDTNLIVIQKITTGVNAKNNYVIVTNDSAIHIRDREVKDTIRFASKSNTLTYDGEAHTLTGFDTLNFTLLAYNTAQTPVVFRIDPASVSATTGAVSTVGTYENAITGTPVLKDANDSIVTSSFIILADTGSLVINPHPITVTARDTSFYYDGLAHNASQMSTPRYTIDSLDLLSGHNLAAEVASETISALDDTAHTVVGTVTITDASSNDVTANYAITKVDGVIKIEGYPQELTISSESHRFDCYNKGQKYEHYTVKYGETTCAAVEGSDYKFVLVPVTGIHDTLTITPTCLGTTAAGSSDSVKNTFTYVLQNDIQYVGTRDTVYGYLTQPDTLTLTLTSDNPVCDDGSVMSYTTGGNGGNTFKLNDNDDDNVGVYNHLAAGDYTVKVTDSKGCSATQNVTLTAIPVTAQEGITRYGAITDYAPDTTVDASGELTDFPALTANGDIIAQPALSGCTAVVVGHTVTMTVNVESIGVLPILVFEVSPDEYFSTRVPMYTHKAAPVTEGAQTFDFENLPAGTYYVRAKLYNCSGGNITAAPITPTVTVE